MSKNLYMKEKYVSLMQNSIFPLKDKTITKTTWALFVCKWYIHIFRVTAETRIVLNVGMLLLNHEWYILTDWHL